MRFELMTKARRCHACIEETVHYQLGPTKKQNSKPRFTLRSNNFSLSAFAAETLGIQTRAVFVLPRRPTRRTFYLFVIPKPRLRGVNYLLRHPAQAVRQAELR